MTEKTSLKCRSYLNTHIKNCH